MKKMGEGERGRPEVYVYLRQSSTALPSAPPRWKLDIRKSKLERAETRQWKLGRENGEPGCSGASEKWDQSQIKAVG